MNCWPKPISSAWWYRSAKTKHLISHRELALMKPSAILVNIARGPVVDEPALIEALQNNRIRGAGLDVIKRAAGRVATVSAEKRRDASAHGSATHETREAMANRALANLRSALMGERPQDLVNPQVWKG
jgi:gluconate 2-dehydrogenase